MRFYCEEIKLVRGDLTELYYNRYQRELNFPSFHFPLHTKEEEKEGEKV